MMRPITTHIVTLNSSDGRKGLARPVHTSLTTAKNPVKTSAFILSWGMGTVMVMNTPPVQ